MVGGGNVGNAGRGRGLSVHFFLLPPGGLISLDVHSQQSLYSACPLPTLRCSEGRGCMYMSVHRTECVGYRCASVYVCVFTGFMSAHVYTHGWGCVRACLCIGLCVDTQHQLPCRRPAAAPARQPGAGLLLAVEDTTRLVISAWHSAADAKGQLRSVFYLQVDSFRGPR